MEEDVEKDTSRVDTEEIKKVKKLIRFFNFFYLAKNFNKFE